MIVYCDTSFLVSYLNEDDVNHKPSRIGAEKWDTHAFVVCEVHLLELPAAVRAATHRGNDAIPDHIARRVINRFDRAVNSKLLLRKPVDMAESVSMARSLGDSHAWRRRHTAFDLWHLAAAWSLSAGAFLTFDRRQSEVAKLLGMRVLQEQ
jgi:predicted nucleic acid-binding protein